MKAWILYFLLLVGFLKANGQGTINVASGKIASQSKEIDFVLGGEMINAVSNSRFSIIPSSIAVGVGFITGITQMEHDDLMVYPNPFVSRIFINLNSVQKIEMLDGRGIVVRSALFGGGELDVSELPQGLYILRIYDGTNSSTIKVVKYENH